MTRWLTIEKAADSTGLPASYFHERTSPTSGVWAEGVVWKWFEGRKLVGGPSKTRWPNCNAATLPMLKARCLSRQ